jgi:hypothetical protein
LAARRRAGKKSEAERGARHGAGATRFGPSVAHPVAAGFFGVAGPNAPPAPLRRVAHERDGDCRRVSDTQDATKFVLPARQVTFQDSIFPCCFYCN